MTEPWEEVVRQMAQKREIWWYKDIDNAQQRRKQLARKWHGLDVIAHTASGTGAVRKAERVYTELQEQKKAIRRMEIQERAKFEQRTADR